MKTDEIVQQYIEAYTEGYVTEFNIKEAACQSDCDECPAAAACEFLAEGQSYPTYIKNYQRLNIQELCEEAL